MRRARLSGYLALALVAAVLCPGCMTTHGQSMLDRMFPADPDESFLGDEAREIDKRLSKSEPRVQF